MDYQDVYYIDGRNATPIVTDHRQPTVTTRFPPGITRTISPTFSPNPTVVSAGWSPTAAPSPVVYSPSGQPYQYAPINSTSWAGVPVQPQYVMAPVAPAAVPPNNLSSILGGFGDIGTLANIAAQVFAAFLPLPASPTPQDTLGDGDAATSAAVNSSNLIRYQNALATFARRDQQILTLGSVLRELFRRPGTVG
jgi:hypothetical protein